MVGDGVGIAGVGRHTSSPRRAMFAMVDIADSTAGSVVYVGRSTGHKVLIRMVGIEYR